MQELGCERVAGSTDETFIGHGLHGPVNAQLAAGVAPFDVAHESLFGEHASIAGHADVYSCGSKIVEIHLDLHLIGLCGIRRCRGGRYGGVFGAHCVSKEIVSSFLL